MTTWSTPSDKNWYVGLMGDAADLNQYQADNLNATMHRTMTMLEHQVLSGTTLVDTPLAFPLKANEAWSAWFLPRVANTGSGDYKLAFTCPSGTTFHMAANWTNTGSVLQQLLWGSSGSSASSDGVSTDTLYAQMVPVWGVVRVGSTPGVFRMQAAQASASGTTTLWKGSSLIAQRISP